jgi:hypothetical protein
MGFGLWHLPSNALSLGKQHQSGSESDLLDTYNYIYTVRRQNQKDVVYRSYPVKAPNYYPICTNGMFFPLVNRHIAGHQGRL